MKSLNVHEQRDKLLDLAKNSVQMIKTFNIAAIEMVRPFEAVIAAIESAKAEELVMCPACKGEGGHIEEQYDGSPLPESCQTCGGTGEIKAEEVKHGAPFAHALIIDGAYHNTHRHELDAKTEGMEIGKRFDLLPLYTHPPVRELSDDDIERIRFECTVQPVDSTKEMAHLSIKTFARAILKAAREKAA